jgi:hypothetical protein
MNVAMFGVAAISMAHHTHSEAYAYLRRQRLFYGGLSGWVGVSRASSHP